MTTPIIGGGVGALVKRTSHYVQRPAHFEVAPCACGNQDLFWSEWQDRVWCHKCAVDFIPAHWGVLDGPIPINAAKFMGMDFRRVNMATGEIYDETEGA